jgi:uncharacterized membrane protein
MKYNFPDNKKYKTKDEYLAWYKQASGNNSNHSPQQEEALKQASDIRKFEIELCWKRAAYFWAFIASAFVAYFSVANEKLESLPVDKKAALFIIALFGLFLSFCWFFINKASHYWIRNWEHQVELLEDEITGPLYKRNIVCNETGCWLTKMILRPYKHSASRINQLLSFAVVIIWGYISIASGYKFLYPLFTCFSAFFTWRYISYILTFIAFVVFVVLFFVLVNYCNHVPKNKKSKPSSPENTWYIEEREIDND